MEEGSIKEAAALLTGDAKRLSNTQIELTFPVLQLIDLIQASE